MLESLKCELAKRTPEDPRRKYAWGNDELSRFKQLINALEMRRVWKFIEKQGMFKETCPHSTIFAAAAFYAICSPHHSSNSASGLTQGEQDKWKKQVVLAANKLANLIRRTELDDYFINRRAAHLFQFNIDKLRDAESKALKVPELIDEPLRELTPFSDLLKEFAEWAPKKIRPVPLARPRNKEAKRTFFVQELAKYFLSTSGEAQIVLILAAVMSAFPELVEMDRHQVKEIVKRQTNSKK